MPTTIDASMSTALIRRLSRRPCPLTTAQAYRYAEISQPTFVHRNGASSATLSLRLRVTREQILAFRRRANGLDERLPAGRAGLERAAWAGLQDSMPRAA